MRLATAAVLALAAAGGLAGCGGGAGNPELEAGRATPARLDDDAEVLAPDRWAVTVELEDRSVDGDQLVVVEVHPSDVRCADGSPADPGRLRAGSGVTVERADDHEVARARPPLIIGSRLVADC